MVPAILKGVRVVSRMMGILETISKSVLIKALERESLSHAQAIELVHQLQKCGLIAEEPSGGYVYLTHDGHCAALGSNVLN